MTTVTLEKAHQSIKEVDCCRSFKTSQTQYTKRSKIYDSEHEVLGVTVQKEAAKLCLKHVKNPKDVKLLDVGAGTGNVALHLRRMGFLGQIDLMDANFEMLFTASQKELNIRNIFCHTLLAEVEIPIKPETYDVVTCVACFDENHVAVSCLKNILEVAKIGGFVIMSHFKAAPVDYFERMTRWIDSLNGVGEMKLIETYDMEYMKHVPGYPIRISVFKRLNL